MTLLRTLLEVPLLWFAAAFAASWLLQRRAAGVRWFAAAEGAASVAILLVVAALNVRTAGFLVSFGANVLSIAAAHAHGQLMYHAVGGPQLYSLVYGPYTFLVYEPMLHQRDALTAVKWELLVLAALAMAAMFLLLRRGGRVPWQTALALTGVAAGFLLAVPAGVLGVRGDVWALCALALALLAVDTAPWWLAGIAAGVGCGFSVGVKATLVVEGLLLLVLLRRRHGVNATIVAAVFAAIVAAAPFASAHISLRNYATWLALSGHRATLPGLVMANVLFAVWLLLPAFFAWRLCGVKSNDDPHRLYLALFSAALLIAIVAGSKSGGGPWHLWPLLPFVLWGMVRRIVDGEPLHMQRLVAALAFGALVVSARWGLRAVRTELPRASQQARTTQQNATAELLNLAGKHPGSPLQMAPGTTMSSDAGDLRYVLVQAGEPYTIDLVAAGEALKTEPFLLWPLADQAAQCGTVWTVPHGDTPFSTRNNNETEAQFPLVFPQTVRAAFGTGHHLLEGGRYFDLWGATQPQGTQSTSCE